MDDNTALTLRYIIFGVLALAVIFYLQPDSDGLLTFFAGLIFPTSHFLSVTSGNGGNDGGRAQPQAG